MPHVAEQSINHLQIPHALSAPLSSPQSTLPPANSETSRQVRLFRNGANQAVRIPKEFELPGKEAVMHREGNRLIIELAPREPKKGTAAALAAALQSMKDWPAVEESFFDAGTGLAPLDEVDL